MSRTKTNGNIVHVGQRLVTPELHWAQKTVGNNI